MSGGAIAGLQLGAVYAMIMGALNQRTCLESRLC